MRRSPFAVRSVSRRLAMALRVVVALVALNLTGLTSIAAEIGLQFDAAADDCCADCPLEKSGKECPPACPICHCAHGTIALPIVSEDAARSFEAPEKTAPITPYEASVSSAPQLPSVYRPPRSRSSSA